MADTDLPLEEFPESTAVATVDGGEPQQATDHAPGFVVPGGRSAVRGKASRSC